MVLQHAHGHFVAPALRLDPARIVAGAGAIALNVAVLMLLLMPARMPPAESADAPPPLAWYLPDKPVTPPTPPVVPVAHPRTTTPRQPALPAQAPTRPAIDQVAVPDGSLPADPAPAVDSTPVDIAPPSGPVAGVQLEYARAPAPPYPIDALRARLEGQVLLRVLVDVDGHPLKVDIERSSGQRTLDEAARRFVLRRWLFRPAMQDGRAVQAVGLVPIDYRLQ